MRGAWTRPLVAIFAAFVSVLAFAPTAIAATPEPYQSGDLGGFRNILPTGENGFENAADAAAFESSGTYPAHSVDQYPLYRDLVFNSPGLSASQIPSFYKDASFGVKSGDEERTYSPPLRCPLGPSSCDVVIVRDKNFGVPHVYGDNRAAVEYGAGYAVAEDRLFFMDVLRHAGRAELSGFAGGSNKDMDREQWEVAPYTEADLERQVNPSIVQQLYGSEGLQALDDVNNFVAGINGYIDEARLDPNKMPVEYSAIGKAEGPDTLGDPSGSTWQASDVVATASLVGGIFGKGGGNEVGSALVLQAAQRRFGRSSGTAVWGDFRRAEDPEAPTTVQKKSFPYEVPKGIKREAVALPDTGSVCTPDPSTGDCPAGAQASAASAPSTSAASSRGLLSLATGNSNALLVSARNSASGRPLAVMGPQVSYFMPQILNEQDLHCIGDCQGGPDIDANGAAFPGVNMWVLLGRGVDYAWSATSAGQDIIDTFAEELCEQDGSSPTINSRSYVYNGQCRSMDTLTQTNNITPNPADQSPPETYTLTALRTVHGIVYKRGLINGRPYAFVRERSTYFHEADSALAFMDMNDPKQIHGPTDFQHAMSKVGYTFNWFYADSRDIAYFNSGNNPVRARGVDPNFPTYGTGKYDWQGFNPDLQTATYTPFDEHPQVVNQGYITSWNNKQAAGYRAADDNFSYGPVFRSLSLDKRVQAGLANGGKLTLAGLIDAMEGAATVDLRGSEVLPYMLDVIGTPSDPQLADAVNTLRAWVNSGAHRIDANQDGHYDSERAVQILDAWWPRAVDAAFRPSLGDTLYNSILSMMHVDDDPHTGSGYHVGSAYIDGWYGYMQKDLRRLLGQSVQGAFSRGYCGGGDLTACRTALTSSLSAALAEPASQLYDEDPNTAGTQRVDTCPSSFSDQMCWDSIRFRPLGVLTVPTIAWQNRPTFQQAVEVQGHR